MVAFGILYTIDGKSFHMVIDGMTFDITTNLPIKGLVPAFIKYILVSSIKTLRFGIVRESRRLFQVLCSNLEAYPYRKIWLQVC